MPGLYTSRYLLPIAGNHRLSLLVHLSSLHHHSLGLGSCWVKSMHPFAVRVVDSHPSVLLHPSGGHNCLTRCRLQMFLKPQVCVENGNRTREHQCGHQSSYWLWTSVLNFSDLTITGVTHSPPHPTNNKKFNIMMKTKFYWEMVKFLFRNMFLNILLV